MKNLIDVDELINFLRSSHLKPKDYLGQNFLVDEIVLDEIIRAAELQKTDTVLEVGPGLGVLTAELLPRAGVVWAIEKDEKLIPILNKRFPNLNNLKIINQDILRFHLEKNISSKYKVVANIPYYLTSKLFQYFLQQHNQPELLVLMVQQEVGERVVAGPGNLSVLGISIQVYADAEIILEVPKTSFWPEPKVDSVVLRITPRKKYPEIVDFESFFRLVKMGFAGKRKQIHNTLATGLQISKTESSQLLVRAGIDPMTRPQDISIAQWIELQKVVNHS